VTKAGGGIFNNAAQHWNHSFYWFSMTPTKTDLEGPLKEKIVQKWGDKANFEKEFCANALANFGSGWTWLVKKDDGLEIVNTSNANTPLRDGLHPLLTVDVWEHAYYIDYRNARAKYLEEFMKVVDWKFVEANFSGPVKHPWE
jgi:Fe-Mn family superoxide dismutase